MILGVASASATMVAADRDGARGSFAAFERTVARDANRRHHRRWPSFGFENVQRLAQQRADEAVQ